MSGSLNISATERTLGEVLSGDFRMEVPKYQREYSWMEEQWNTFWNDLMNLSEGETHFLGSIVVVERNTPIGELDVVDVVDGQQRLATASILLAEMKLQYEIEQEDGIVNKINEYLWTHNQHDRRFPSLKLGYFNKNDYETLIKGDIPKNNDSNIKKAAEFFQEKLSSMSVDEMDRLRIRLLDAMTVVRIQCTDDESAFKLFETLNDRGLVLSAVDLMKNHLFKKASENSDINYTAVEDSWKEIMENIRHNLTRPRRFFIHYIISSSKYDVTNAITKNTLYDDFQTIICEVRENNGITVEEYIEDMANMSDIYVDIANSNTDVYADNDANEKINRILKNLDRMGSTQERSLLLGLFRRVDNPTEMIRMLRLIESFVVRGRLTDITTGKTLTKLYAGICSDITDGQDMVSYLSRRLSDRAPDDDIFAASIRNSDFTRSDRTRYILEKYEDVYYPGDDRQASMEGEIEHIAPRKAFTADKYTTWPDYLSTSKEEFQSVVNKIGNLILLEERLNIEASDDPFEQKKNHYSQSDFEMPRAIKRNSEWSVDLINDRTDRLAKAAPGIWDFSQ